jgi:hypothetical protein
MATYQRPPTNPVVDAHRSSRWPVFLILFLGIAAIGGGVAYDRYVANAPIVLTPTRPTEPSAKSRPTQPTSPSTQPTRPGQSRPTQTSSGMPEWMPLVFAAIPFIFIGVIVLVIVGWIRKVRRQAAGGATISGGSTGHWAGGQHVGTGGAAAGPWARQPGVATTGNVASTPPDAPVKRKGGGLPLLPIIVGAIILDQAVFNGRYSREALNWIMKFVEGFSR